MEMIHPPIYLKNNSPKNEIIYLRLKVFIHPHIITNFYALKVVNINTVLAT